MLGKESGEAGPHFTTTRRRSDDAIVTFECLSRPPPASRVFFPKNLVVLVLDRVKKDLNGGSIAREKKLAIQLWCHGSAAASSSNFYRFASLA